MNIKVEDTDIVNEALKRSLGLYINTKLQSEILLLSECSLRTFA